MVNLDEINNSVFNEWSNFLKDFSEAKTQEDKDDYRNLFLKQLSILEKETDNLFKTVQRSKIEVADVYFPLLWLHGINPYDITEIDPYTENCFDEVTNSFGTYREISNLIDGELAHWVPQVVVPYLSMIKLDYMTNHTIVEAYYYTYLMLLTHLPESTHDKFYKMSTKWETMPQTGLGLSDKEYERLMNMAYDRCDKQLNEHQRLQEEADNLLDIINAQLENILKEE